MLLHSLTAYINKHNLLTPGQTLIVGVSGGPDSVALLHLLTRLQPTYHLHLIVAHLNHSLRPQAQQDAEFVQALAQSCNLDCIVEQVDVKALAAREKRSIEEAGRLARHTFFARLGPTVALAHHADDQAETVLMHFLRGSGLAGMRGMQPLSHQSAPQPLTLIRPLLDTTRAQIEAYLTQHQLSFVVDATNTDTSFFRNRLRHELLPLLETYNPNIRQVLGRTAQAASGDYELLRDLVDKAMHDTALTPDDPRSVRFELARWRALPLGLRRALLRQAVAHWRPNLRDLDFTPLENAIQWAQTAQSGHRADLMGGLAVEIVGSELRVVEQNRPPVEPPPVTPLLIPGETAFPNYHFTTALTASVSLAQIQSQPDPWTAYLNPALAPFSIRTRRPGDRFAPLGLSGSLKLSDFMVNRKLPVDQRDTWPLVCTGPEAQTIAWVCGQALSNLAKATDQQPAIKIRVDPTQRKGGS